MNSPNPAKSRSALLTAAVALVAIVLSGCGRDARLADHELRDPKPGPVTAYGKTLDANASPQDVVYVLLQAINDDYAAGDNREARHKALDTEFAVCAPEWIKARRGGENLTEREKRERLFEVVYNWAPTLGFYRDSFKGAFPDIAQQMHTVYAAQPVSQHEVAVVYVNLKHPHPETAGPNSGAAALVQLVREAGYWRIWWVGFDNEVRDWRKRFPEQSPTANFVQPGTGDAPASDSTEPADEPEDDTPTTPE